MKDKDTFLTIGFTKNVKVVLLNVFCLIFFLILFEPAWNVDDCTLASDLYGAYTGTYNDNAVYTTPIYSKWICLLLSVCGKIPWFTVMAFVLVFIALTLVSYVILFYQDNRMGWIACILMLLFFGYEGYVCMQWTKVSAIALGAGAFVLCSRIDKRFVRSVAILEMLMGGFLRSANINLVIGVWLVTLSIHFLSSFMAKDKDRLKKIVVRLTELILIFLFFTFCLSISNNKSDSEVGVEDYKLWNYYRIQSQDYGMPSYDQNIDVYQKYGITEDEWLFVNAWGLDVYNVELYKNLWEAKNEIEKSKISETMGLHISNVLLGFFKEYPRNLLDIDVFFCYVLLILLVTFNGRRKNSVKILLMTFGLLMVLNFYLFVKGRYFYHRVDVGIVFNICLMLISLYWDDATYVPVNGKKNNYRIRIAVCILLLVVPFFRFGDHLSFIPAKELKMNREFAQYSMEDSHFFLFANTKENNLRKIVPNGVFDIPPKGMLKNTFGITLPTPEVQAAMKDFGVNDPYCDIVNNQNMYFVTDEKEGGKDTVVGYVGERVNHKVQEKLVKKVLNKKIFRLNSGNITDVYSFENISDDCTNLVNDISYQLDDSELKMKGTLYIEKQNDFYQNVYVDIVDKQTGKHELFYTLQEQNKGFEVGEPGWCSKISSVIELPDFYDREDDIYLIIETLNETYRCRVDI